MPVNWPFAECLNLRGTGKVQIDARDAERQAVTAREILRDLTNQPGMVLADEVGMGKTYVALAVAASVLVATRGQQGPVVVMVPSGLRGKWQREWDQFKRQCAAGGELDWIKDTYAHSPTDFFELLDDSSSRRRHLVFTTTGCFSRGIGHRPWIKLAMIRLARRHTKLNESQKRRLYRWAVDLVRQTSKRQLTEQLVERLLNSSLTEWHAVLLDAGLLAEGADDPIPELLEKYEAKLDWQPLAKVLRNALPQRDSKNLAARLKSTAKEFNTACGTIYDEWLQVSSWHTPLLILDEAHHAKNDATRLSEMFRESRRSKTKLLAGKFQRMLFLTATPFQLGHLELIHILKSFGGIRWNGRYAPNMTGDDFDVAMKKLEDALDDNRRAGRGLEKLWGSVRDDNLGESTVDEWWRRVESGPDGTLEERLVQAVVGARQTRDAAQRLLKPWVVRHNRPATLTGSVSATAQPRRVSLAGRAILDDSASRSVIEAGLPVERTAALPFLLTARAQGELAMHSGARAFFAEGLASSFEAFHHTRIARDAARDMDDDGGIPQSTSEDECRTLETLIPVAWYEEQVAKLIPSRAASSDELLQHPKVRATVDRAVKLWLDGEKVLVFCFYRETCKSLFQHIRDGVQAATFRLAANKLGSEFHDNEAAVRAFLDRVRDRLSEERSPFHREVNDLLLTCFQSPEYAALAPHRDQLIEVLAAYFRSPSFIARYLPLGDPAVQAAWQPREGRRIVLEPGIAALRRGILEQTDRSNLTCLDRVYQFLNFAVELADRARCQIEARSDEPDDEARNPLDAYLHAVSVFSRTRRGTAPEDIDDSDNDEGSSARAKDDGSYRAVPLVRLVHGETKTDRERLALAFNSPLFKEILVSSRVMGEGIDLHRFCRHVIHHDGCWNPSTLEQQTGRLDRIRCKAEVSSHPIAIYQPFIAGSADEKMFRVLRDRERWFQVVMGQKFEFDEATSEAIAARVPLPESLAKELTFDLTRWQPLTTMPVVHSRID
ncbi:MAG: helicase-related protein [Planctomycetia bacterium]|nr:helicase-related protein [Planctomycetia bacterium]